jgi:hypothetical protein
MNRPLTIERDIHFVTESCRRANTEQPASIDVPCGRVPRIARLMALAIRFDQYMADGIVSSYGELAVLSRVTRARITQIMNLRMLAPDIQETILFLPRVESGHDPICLRPLQSIAGELEWSKQRRLWKRLLSSTS